MFFQISINIRYLCNIYLFLLHLIKHWSIQLSPMRQGSSAWTWFLFLILPFFCAVIPHSALSLHWPTFAYTSLCFTGARLADGWHSANTPPTPTSRFLCTNTLFPTSLCTSCVHKYKTHNTVPPTGLQYGPPKKRKLSGHTFFASPYADLLSSLPNPTFFTQHCLSVCGSSSHLSIYSGSVLVCVCVSARPLCNLELHGSENCFGCSVC